jgi:hypothetical protein
MQHTEQLTHKEPTAGYEQPTGRRRRWSRFALHYLEMVVAMLVGMLLLGPALRVVLGAAGLLDGRDATSHWYRLPELEQGHPEVNWQRGIRYIDDGHVITTGGLLSSVDGTLRVIERLLDAGADASAAPVPRMARPADPQPTHR